MTKNALARAALPILALLACGAASATNLFDPTVSSTSVLDGSSVRLDGTLRDVNGDAQPWTTQVYAFPGECVRVFVTSTGFDAQLAVISPSGTVFRDDDGGGFNRPLVKIASAPEQGWYTVQVATFLGRPVVSNFTMLYGRYSARNANCNNPTLPFQGIGDAEAAKRAAFAAQQEASSAK